MKINIEIILHELIDSILDEVNFDRFDLRNNSSRRTVDGSLDGSEEYSLKEEAGGFSIEGVPRLNSDVKDGKAVYWLIGRSRMF